MNHRCEKKGPIGPFFLMLSGDAYISYRKKVGVFSSTPFFGLR
ncbi:hypothetical protein [Klebsiella phage vB_KpnS-VAC110]|uniref:Uncharacterized protein n=2 Tax=Webervirus TaxID=1920860 RepID=A0AAE8YE49_9CAUD|nr:hypothetical protein [Klebsiella phage vB_KpnS-VAC113]UKL59190.1 hypothetical protein [Klebsiella phage vB_KpnS-VAC110]